MSEAITAVIVAVVAGMWSWVTARQGRKGDRENALIDQLQEDRDKDRQRLDVLTAKVSALERQLIRLLSRDQQWAIHAERIEGQVVDLGGTPHPRPLALREEHDAPRD